LTFFPSDLFLEPLSKHTVALPICLQTKSFFFFGFSRFPFGLNFFPSFIFEPDDFPLGFLTRRTLNFFMSPDFLEGFLVAGIIVYDEKVINYMFATTEQEQCFEALKKKYCNTRKNTCKFFLDIMDILLDDEPSKAERCLWRLEPEFEPVVRLPDDGYCFRCQQDMVRDETQSFCICVSCGLCKPILVFKQNYSDMTFEFTGYAYQRITHFRKHWRILEKEIGVNKRIDKYSDRAELMFRRVENLFRKYKPETRKNFFNYKYILIKFFELFNRPDIRNFMNHLKSKEKLRAHDEIWFEICNEMKWPFKSSKRRIEHKRCYKKKRIRFRKKKKI